MNQRNADLKQMLLDVIAAIRPADRETMAEAACRQDSLAKPPGSLGGLEEIAVRMAGITGQVIPGEAQDTGQHRMDRTTPANSRTDKDGPAGADEDGPAGADKDGPAGADKDGPAGADKDGPAGADKDGPAGADKDGPAGADDPDLKEAGSMPDAAELIASEPAVSFPGPGCVIVFCADNGVVAQGVASAPQSVTRAQTINFTRRLTGVGALSRSFGSDLLIVDMGVKDPIPGELYDDVPLRDTHKIIDRRIRPGTWDISQGPAMTEEEAVRAMAAGVEMAQAAARAGFGILGIGEMGIGNTTTSAAVLSAITGAGADQTCGRGGGVNDRGFRRKQEIVEAIRSEFRDRPEQKELTDNPVAVTARLDRIVRVLSRCGGFDLAAMTGAYLGAAAERIPVVIDGYISVVAALTAAEIAPAAADCMFASHVSAEPGYQLAIGRLAEYSPGLKPFLALDMRLGEGSGCPIAFEVIRGACDVMRNMATFDEAEINDDYLAEVRAGGCF